VKKNYKFHYKIFKENVEAFGNQQKKSVMYEIFFGYNR
jgi:hypothetical protein